MSYNHFDLYTLASKLLLPTLQNLTMDAITSFYADNHAVLNASQIRRISDETQDGCALRRYAARTVAFILVKYHDLTGWSLDVVQALLEEISELDRDFLAHERHLGASDGRS